MSSINWQRLGMFVLRLGIAFAFLYPPISAWGDPNDWIGYFPQFMLAGAQSLGIPQLVLLHGFGVIEILIALWIIWGRNVFWPSIVACGMLVFIVLFNTANFIVVFRDLSIAAAALALALMHMPAMFTTVRVEP